MQELKPIKEGKVREIYDNERNCPDSDVQILV